MNALVPPAVFSASAFEPTRRFAAWRDTFGHGIARVDAATEDTERFHADIKIQPLPELVLAHNDVGSVSLMRGRSMLSDGDDGCTFAICIDGGADVGFGDRQVKLRPGMATLVPHHLAGGMTTRGRAVSYSLRFDRAIASTLTPDIDARMVTATHADDPSLKILVGYCELLLAHQGGIEVASAALFSGQLRELVANVLNPRSKVVRDAQFGGVRAARLQAVLNHIRMELRSEGLSAASVAAHLGFTPRYVHQLMDDAGLTFSQHVRDLRLDEAKRLLTRSHADHLRITDIAYLVGFRDLSYFNREFRRRFGETPRDVRKGG